MTPTIVEGDLLDQQVAVIVNAWNRNVIPWWLLLPQGVSGAIKRRGGTKPFRELGWRPIPLGAARLTGAGALPYEAIIHVAAIDLLWRASAASVASSVEAAMTLVEAYRFASVAFPVLGAGSGGLHEAEALEAMLATFARLDTDAHVVVVRFRLNSRHRS